MYYLALSEGNFLVHRVLRPIGKKSGIFVRKFFRKTSCRAAFSCAHVCMCVLFKDRRSILDLHRSDEISSSDEIFHHRMKSEKIGR